MGTHAFVAWNRPDFGALCMVSAYLDATVDEAHRLLTALRLSSRGDGPPAITRRPWALLATLRELREVLDISWDELASGWADVDRATPLADPGGDLLGALARWLHADPGELAALIDGHGRLLGLDRATSALDATAPTLRAVRRLWWRKGWLGVSVDEFLALESCLLADDPAADLLASESPTALLRAARLVRWSRRLGLPLLDLLSHP
ncbi:MAG: hypothetical protein JWM10_4061 [Myxococcaceae bacterium]|nr:hypothetical protein [Myxococcaceae bacterium]